MPTKLVTLRWVINYAGYVLHCCYDPNENCARKHSIDLNISQVHSNTENEHVARHTFLFIYSTEDDVTQKVTLLYDFIAHRLKASPESYRALRKTLKEFDWYFISTRY